MKRFEQLSLRNCNNKRCTSPFHSVKSNGHCLKSYKTCEVENAPSAASFPLSQADQNGHIGSVFAHSGSSRVDSRCDSVSVLIPCAP